MIPMTDAWGWGWFGMFAMLLTPILWIALIAGAVWVVLRLTGAQPGAQPRSEGNTALRILEERLARGDIDIEDFRTRRDAIESKR